MKFYRRIEEVQVFDKPGKYILYWMQGAFRTRYNHSLLKIFKKIVKYVFQYFYYFIIYCVIYFQIGGSYEVL